MSILYKTEPTMHIYIRHAEDDCSNEDTKHDGHLTDNGVKQAEKMVLYLAQKYGLPDKIYCSPFRRTQETAKIFKKVLLTIPEYYNNKISKDVRLCKYFAGNQKNDPKVHDKTLKYIYNIHETKDDVRDRFYIQYKETDKKYSGGNVWCITHAIGVSVMSKIAETRLHDEDFIYYTVVNNIRD